MRKTAGPYRLICGSAVFLCNRKCRGIPCYIKKHKRAKDAHSREDVDCRTRPREARERARHILFIQWKVPNVQGILFAFLTEDLEAEVNKFYKMIIITIIDI